MAKQVCNNCQERFTWKELQSSFFRGYKPLSCRRCNKVYQVTDLSKLIIGMLITFPIIFFVLLVASMIGLTGLQTFFLGCIILFIILAIHPYISRYEDIQEEANK